MSPRVDAILPCWLDRPDEEALDIAGAATRSGLDGLWIGELLSFDAFALATAAGLRAPGLPLNRLRLARPRRARRRGPARRARPARSHPSQGGRPVTRTNAQVRLAARPVGLPKDSDWDYVEEPAPEPAEGQFLVELEYLSVDPAMRAWMNPGRTYVPPVGIGEVMHAGGIGRVVESRHHEYAVGEHVSAAFGVQRYAVSDGGGVVRVDTGVAEPPVHLGTLGTSGLTAYFGLLDVGRPEPGQTVVVSGAAGSVGNVVGQIARIKGCRAVGIAGGAEKCRWLTEELGFDAAVDYKAGDVRGRLREAAPDRIDVFFDNVGGPVLEAGLSRLARGARVVLSGAVSQYNATEPPPGPSNYMNLLVMRASMTGFVVFDYAGAYREAVAQLGAWLRSGELRSREHVVHGDIASFPEALLGLFRGENTGKLVLAV